MRELVPFLYLQTAFFVTSPMSTAIEAMLMEEIPLESMGNVLPENVKVVHLFDAFTMPS